jgi:chitodextrinase
VTWTFRLVAALLSALIATTVVLVRDNRSAWAASQPSPVLVQAQALNGSTVALMWTAVSNVDGYDIYRNAAKVASTEATNFNDGGLAPLTTYTYQVAPVSGGIEVGLSNSVTATTQTPPDSSAPTEPGTITVSSVSSSSARLTWGKSTDNIMVEGYRILRGGPADLPSALVDIWTVDGVKNSYSAAGLRSGTTYQFGIAAFDPDDNVSPIRTVTFKTVASTNTVPPAAPSSAGVGIKVFSPTRIDVTWGASSSSDVSGYTVLRDGNRVGKVDLPMRSTYSDNGLQPGTTHSYAVEAIDSAGNISAPTTAKSATTLLSGQLRVARGPYVLWTTAYSARVAWWTDLPSQSVVSYGVGGLTTQLVDRATTVRHVMLVGPLSAGATYEYAVGDGAFQTSTASLTTAAPPGVTFSFAAIGDYGSNSPGESQNARLINADATQLIQSVGDNVYPEAMDPDFLTFYSDYDNRFFKQFGPALTHEIFWTANGNDDYFGHGAIWRVASLPNNQEWFSYDWGDAHVLVLDTERPYAPGTPQYAYAQADLAAHQSNVWRIVVFHHPAYSSTSSNSSSAPVQQYLVPLLQAEKVQLVLSGHSHNYERTFPLINSQPTPGGVTYIVTGAGGNSFNPFTIPEPSWSAFREDTRYEYVRVTVSRTLLLLQTISASDGTIIDSDSISAP